MSVADVLTVDIARDIIITMLAIVLDTGILVTAFRSNAGASRYLLEATRQRRCSLLLSVPLLLEYEAVLTRPEHLVASGATIEDVAAVLDELALLAKRVTLVVRARPVLPDANDEMVLETAINGGADAIVTFNEKHFREAAEIFGLKVWRPAEALLALSAKRQGKAEI